MEWTPAFARKSFGDRCVRSGADRRRHRVGRLLVLSSPGLSLLLRAGTFRLGVLVFSAGVVSLSSAALAASALSNASATCVGDCDDSGAVTVEELVRGVSIALGTLSLDQCPRFDCHATGQVTVDCLINAVSRH